MKSFIFLKVYIFEDLLILNALYSNYIPNITFKQFTKCCFTFDSTILFKKWSNKEEDDTFLRKKAEEKQNSATIIIFLDEKGAVFPVKLKLQGESFE